MGLTPKYSTKDVERMIAGGVIRIENDIIQILEYCGEQFVSEARQALNISAVFPKGDYSDRTTNLRSSIGYFVVSNGDIVSSGLKGTSKGMTAAKRAIGGIPKGGYQLIGVAGMEYASYVESMGYNVITSQQDTVLVDLKDLLKDYQRRMNDKGLALDYDIVGSLTKGMYRS